MLEAVEKYDIDGVHFDDFFYPYPEAAAGLPRRRRASPTYGAGKSRATGGGHNVNTLVQEMNERIKQLKPWVKFGISPFGIWRNNADRPARLGHQRPAELRRHLRRHPQVGQARAGSTTSCRSCTGTIGFAKADYAKLLPWWAELVRAPACSSTSARPTTGSARRARGATRPSWTEQLTLNDQ